MSFEGKILHLLPYNGIGGTEKAVLYLCLANPNCVAGVLFTFDGPARQLFEEHGFETYVLRADQESIRIDEIVSYFFNISDIIHIHTCHNVPVLYEFIKKAKKPFLITVQWPTIIQKIHVPVICVSTSVAEKQINKKCHIIPNGIQINLFIPCNQKTRYPKLIRVCRPEKCAPYFWKAVADYLNNNSQSKLVVVGENGIGNKQIIFLGQRTDVHYLLSRCQIFAYTPHSHVGAHDLVILEAMASGLVVVAPDVSCVNGSIIHNYSGILTRFGDAKQFSDSLELLSRDQNLRVEYSKNAQNEVREKFSNFRMFSEYQQIYKIL